MIWPDQQQDERRLDWRDLRIETLAHDLDMATSYEDDLVRVTVERNAYRELARAAVAQLHEAHLNAQIARARFEHLLEEHRALIAQTVAPPPQLNVDRPPLHEEAQVKSAFDLPDRIASNAGSYLSLAQFVAARAQQRQQQEMAQ